jgi:hypothetical protein
MDYFHMGRLEKNEQFGYFDYCILQIIIPHILN